MAAAYNNLIAVISVFTFDTLHTLKGHNESILSLAFSADDRYLFSGGEDGAVYQWDMETGERVHEVVQKVCLLSYMKLTIKILYFLFRVYPTRP